MTKSLFFIYFFIAFGFPTWAHALTVSPSKIEISGNPGEAIFNTITLTNKKEAVQNYSVSFENFRQRGNSEVPQFVGSDYGLATWMRVPEEAVTLPGEETILPFSVVIPENALPGGYFAAIFFEDSNLNNDPSLVIAEKVGILVFLTVNGEIKESGQITSFGLVDEKKIVTGMPFVFNYHINNEGGDRILPRGTIRIFNSFGSQIEEVVINSNQSNVLPGNNRKFEVFVGEEEKQHQNFFTAVSTQLKDFKFGRYTAKIEVMWGENNTTERKTYNFLVLPWQSIILVILIIFGSYKMVCITIRRYNNRVLSSSRNHGRNSLF